MESEQSPLLPPRCTHSCQWSGYLLLCPVERDRRSEHKLLQELTVLLESKAAQLRPLTAAKKPAERNSDTQAARTSPTQSIPEREPLICSRHWVSHRTRPFLQHAKAQCSPPPLGRVTRHQRILDMPCSHMGCITTSSPSLCTSQNTAQVRLFPFLSLQRAPHGGLIPAQHLHLISEPIVLILHT